MVEEVELRGHATNNDMFEGLSIIVTESRQDAPAPRLFFLHRR